ncbi:hypothetical protein ACEK07_32695 [Alcanivoracaceae bacterium MT1]
MPIEATVSQARGPHDVTRLAPNMSDASFMGALAFMVRKELGISGISTTARVFPARQQSNWLFLLPSMAMRPVR